MIGKSVETALVARIAEDARVGGASALTAEFIDSGRNQVASTFLSQHGFTPAGGTHWIRPLDLAGPAWPAWITSAERRSSGEQRANSESAAR